VSPKRSTLQVRRQKYKLFTVKVFTFKCLHYNTRRIHSSEQRRRVVWTDIALEMPLEHSSSGVETPPHEARGAASVLSPSKATACALYSSTPQGGNTQRCPAGPATPLSPSSGGSFCTWYVQSYIQTYIETLQTLQSLLPEGACLHMR